MRYLALLAMVVAVTPVAVPKDLEDPIRVGMSAAFSGPAQSLGLGMKLGIECYFRQVNQRGGIFGRPIELVAMDDGYEPESAIRNMNQLIDAERVIAVLGNVGTPTAKVTVPIANEKMTLLFGAFTGAGLLRFPPSRYVINFRASYAQETAAMVKGLLAAGIAPYEIAVFSQDDAYGDAGFSGVTQGLAAAGYDAIESLPHGRYQRNTTDIEAGLLTILDAPVPPRAVIIIGTYAASAEFISMAKKKLPDAIFMNVSFVGSVALLKALGPEGEGVVVTQVVPHFNADLPLIEDYQAELVAYDPSAEPGFVSLEGYIVAKIFIEGLRRAGPGFDRESIVDALLGIENLDIGIGTPVDYGQEPYQGSQSVWPTIIRDGAYHSVDLRTHLKRLRE